MVEDKRDKNGVAIQGVEDSTLGPQEKEKEKEQMPADGVGTVLLCVFGYLNGVSVIFLIDSRASECFVGTTLTEKNRLQKTKTKEK